MAQPSKLSAFLFCSSLFVASAALNAESKNPADYPLRFHIYVRAEHNHYHHGVQDDAKGEGRANLFADGEVHGVDFSFDCSERVEASAGYETYLAKWKKPSKQLVVLLPVFGKAGAFQACNFDVDVKDVAYFKHNQDIETESPEAFKAWMVKHNYDPEHGRNEPVKADPEKDPSSSPAPPPPPAQ